MDDISENDFALISKERLRAWLFDRAKMHQDRGEWDESFEDLYPTTPALGNRTEPEEKGGA